MGARQKNSNPSLWMFNHSKAMHLLAAGVMIVYIRDLLCHADISTMIYAKADNRLKEEAVNKLALTARLLPTPLPKVLSYGYAPRRRYWLLARLCQACLFHAVCYAPNWRTEYNF